MRTKQEISEDNVFWTIILVVAIVLLLTTGCNDSYAEPEQPDIFDITIVVGGAELTPHDTTRGVMFYHAPTLLQTYSEDFRLDAICRDNKFVKDLYLVNHIRGVQPVYDDETPLGRLVEEIDSF